MENPFSDWRQDDPCTDAGAWLRRKGLCRDAAVAAFLTWIWWQIEPWRDVGMGSLAHAHHVWGWTPDDFRRAWDAFRMGRASYRAEVV